MQPPLFYASYGPVGTVRGGKYPQPLAYSERETYSCGKKMTSQSLRVENTFPQALYTRDIVGLA